MTRSQARSLHAATLLVGLTGLVYAYMRYLAEPADPFALSNHPYEPLLRDLHILCAPLLVFACGWIWQEHVWKRVAAGFAPRRRSGLALFGLAAPMILSGYFLQVSADPSWGRFWIALHLATSGLWLSAYLVHQFSPRRSAAVALRADPAPGGSGDTPAPRATAPPPASASKPGGGGGAPARS